MTSKIKFKVFVVEDDPNWNHALCEMYRDILNYIEPSVEAIFSGKGVLDRIGNGEKFDLLSLDINLWKTHPKTPEGIPDLTIEGAYGGSILRRAAEEKACKAVIVITQTPSDEELHLVIPDENERKIVRMTLNAYLNRLFPRDRSLYLKKESDMSIEENINIFNREGNLTANKIVDMCGIINKFRKEGQCWCIQFSGKTKLLKDCRGLRYISYLIENQNIWKSCDELIFQARKDFCVDDSVLSQMNEEELEKESLKVVKRVELDEKSDRRTINELKKRLADMIVEREKAKKENDLSRLKTLETEREKIEEYLNSVQGFRGRLKRFPNISERNRQSVSKAINDTLKVIKKEHIGLYHHLDGAIKKGYKCIYRPLYTIKWDL